METPNIGPAFRPQRVEGERAAPAGGALRFASDARWGEYRLHQAVVPLTRHLEMGGRAQFEGFDKVVVDIGVDAGLLEGVECRARRAAGDEPVSSRSGGLRNLPVAQT